MPPNSVGRLSSPAAIRELTAAVELTDWYLCARVDRRAGEGPDARPVLTAMRRPAARSAGGPEEHAGNDASLADRPIGSK
jgi:hypothetical protein